MRDGHVDATSTPRENGIVGSALAAPWRTRLTGSAWLAPAVIHEVPENASAKADPTGFLAPRFSGPACGAFFRVSRVLRNHGNTPQVGPLRSGFISRGTGGPPVSFFGKHGRAAHATWVLKPLLNGDQKRTCFKRYDRQHMRKLQLNICLALAATLIASLISRAAEKPAPGHATPAHPPSG